MASPTDRQFLDLAARLARRAVGLVEPNPPVGAVLADPAGSVIGMGHHERFGGIHAEVAALADCARRANDPKGATLYVTLEPCNGHGKQPPCTAAVLRAGIGRVVYASIDPSTGKGGGADALRRAGVAVDRCLGSRAALALAEPFLKRTATGLPWVIAKWAQTIDGRIATANGESKWISGPLSRRRVHQLRARVDAVITGTGTLLADDPELTARGVPIRRRAVRVLIDRDGSPPTTCRLVATRDRGPVVVASDDSTDRNEAAARLARFGIENIRTPRLPASEDLDLRAVLAALAALHPTHTVLLEAGPRLLGSFFSQGLVDEAQVFVAPAILGDPRSRSAVSRMHTDRLADMPRFSLVRHGRCGNDLHLIYRRSL